VNDETKSKRVRRETPTRQGPNRGWSSTFGGSSTRNASERDGVRSGVNLGYRVVDDYISMGRDMASTFWQPLTGDSNGDGATPDMEQLTTRVMQYASDFAAAWVDLVEKTMANGPGPMSSHQPPKYAATTNASSATTSSSSASSRSNEGLMPVVFEVRSSRRTQLSAEVRSGAAAYLTQRLRPADGEGEGIAVATRLEDDKLVFSVDVGDEVPAGRYTSCVVDEISNVTRGTLSLNLLGD
jgi:hypothetical protein